MGEDERNALIGERVRLNQERRLQHNAQMYPIWLAEGLQFRTLRQNAHISQREISRNIGANVRVIQRFERGLYVRRRSVVRAAYLLAIENILSRRNSAVETFRRNLDAPSEMDLNSTTA